jgi:hypothetical protein
MRDRFDRELMRQMMQEHFDSLPDSPRKQRLTDLYGRMESPRFNAEQKRAIHPMINRLEKSLQFPMQSPMPEGLMARYPIPDMNPAPSAPAPLPDRPGLTAPPRNPLVGTPWEGRTDLFGDSPLVIEVDGERYTLA